MIILTSNILDSRSKNFSDIIFSGTEVSSRNLYWEIIKTNMIREWINNCIHIKERHVVMQQCPNFKDALNLALNLDE